MVHAKPICTLTKWAKLYRQHLERRFLERERLNALHLRHNDHNGVSYHQPHDCLLNRLFGRRSKKTSKLRVTGLCAGNSPGPVNSPHKGPVTRKMFPFADVIMECISLKCVLGAHIDDRSVLGQVVARCDNLQS